MEMLKDKAARASYEHLARNGVLPQGWEMVMAEASLCVREHDHGQWARLAEVVKDYRPPLLVRVLHAVLDWVIDERVEEPHKGFTLKRGQI